MLDDDSVAAAGAFRLDGNRTLIAAAEPALDAAARKLADLLHAELTASNPLAAYVDVECEIEHLYATRAGDAEQLVGQAQALAIDPVRDRKALIRIDDALAGHMFSTCDQDRQQYQARKP
jgi:hypothetical protein